MISTAPSGGGGGKEEASVPSPFYDRTSAFSSSFASSSSSSFSSSSFSTKDDDLLHSINSFTKDCHNDSQLTGYGRQSMSTKTTREVKLVLDITMKYRNDILKQIGVFSSLTEEQLTSAAQIMDEFTYTKGDFVFRQGDIANAFFIIQEGMVEVTRRNNSADSTDKEIFLKHLKKDDYFGEIALFTSDNRSANIKVISETALILSMDKAKFIDLTASFNKKMSEARLAIGKDAMRHIPLFRHLSNKSFNICLRAMQHTTFLPNIFICKQGMLGNTMYIITEGTCKVTFRTTSSSIEAQSPEGKVMSLQNLLPGDFFGMEALTERRHIRPTSVMTLSSVHVLQLTKAEFENLTKGDLGNEILGKKSSFMRKSELKNMSMDIRTIELLKRRRLTGFNINLTKCSLKLSNLFKRVAKAFFESLVITMYFKMYRTMVLSQGLTSAYGDYAEAIMAHESKTRYECTKEIEAKLKEISGKDIMKRTTQDVKFIVGIMSQKNELKYRMCETWTAIEFSNLCRTLTAVSFPKFRQIFALEERCTCAYVVLKGCVRIFVENPDTGTPMLEYDLAPGDLFGQDALAGGDIRTSWAWSMTAVDLMKVERDDYIDSQDQKSMSAAATIENRYDFLKRIPLFKDWEKFRLLRLAQNLTQEYYPKGSFVSKRGMESKNLYFIYNGVIDVLSAHAKSPFNITSLHKYEYFGETGYINSRKKSGVKLVEEFHMMVASKADIFVLAAEFYDYIDNNVYGLVGSIYDTKLRSRSEILQSMVSINRMKFSNSRMNNYNSSSSSSLSSSSEAHKFDDYTSHDLRFAVSTNSTTSDSRQITMTSPQKTILDDRSGDIDDDISSMGSLDNNSINNSNNNKNSGGKLGGSKNDNKNDSKNDDDDDLSVASSTLSVGMFPLPAPRDFGRCYSDSKKSYIMAPPPVYLDPLKKISKHEKLLLEDIPNLCNGGINPLSCCILTNRQANKVRKQLADSKKLKYSTGMKANPK